MAHHIRPLDDHGRRWHGLELESRRLAAIRAARAVLETPDAGFEPDQDRNAQDAAGYPPPVQECRLVPVLAECSPAAQRLARLIALDQEQQAAAEPQDAEAGALRDVLTDYATTIGAGAMLAEVAATLSQLQPHCLPRLGAHLEHTAAALRLLASSAEHAEQQDAAELDPRTPGAAQRRTAGAR